MTVNEMHIAVNQGVQKIASFQVDNLLPQEIDHELNLAMMRFIKQRFSPTSNRIGKGFEQSQKRIDDLRTLLVEHSNSTDSQGVVYTSNYSDVYVDRYTLPLDYLFLISVRTLVQYGCGGAVAIVSEETVTKAIKIDLTPPAPGYVLTAISRRNSVGTYEIITNLPLGQEITPDLLINNNNYNFGILPATSAEVVNYGITTQDPIQADSNHLYLIKYADYTGDPIWYGPNYVSLTWMPSNGNMAGQLPPVFSNEIEVAAKTTRKSDGSKQMTSLASFGQHDDILYMMDDPFNKAWYKEPTYTIEGNYIDVYTDNEFVVPKVTIKYIRKPLEISITKGIGCELAVHTHHEIIEMTIKSILEGIQDPRYQTQSMETLESE